MQHMHKQWTRTWCQGCLGQLLSDHTCPNWIWTSAVQFQQNLFKWMPHKSRIYGRAAIQKLFVTKPKRCIKQKQWKKWSSDSSFTVFPAFRRVYLTSQPKDACSPQHRLPAVTHGEGSVSVRAGSHTNPNCHVTVTQDNTNAS